VWGESPEHQSKKELLECEGRDLSALEKESLGMPRGKISSDGVNPAFDPKHPHERGSTGG
jgi:hypothetical protein